jgi:aminoglycoside phosphotransferase (APT) family kinase protein
MAKSGAHSLPAKERQAAIADAVTVGRRLGLRIAEPIVLSDNLNLIVEMRPAGVVARVAVRTALVRSSQALGDSLRLAHFLASAGLPVAPVAGGIDPGPHTGPATGRAMTFWRLLEPGPAGTSVDARAAGRSLRAIHEAAAGWDGELGHLGPLVEIDRLIERIAPHRPRAAEELRSFRAAVVVPDGPVQAVHGDAHLGNVFVVPGGQVWIDWEESWRGPVAWDLACLDHRRRVFGELVEPIGAAFAAYGPVDEADVEAWAPVVATWALAWGAVGAVELGQSISSRARRRRSWLTRWLEGIRASGE